MRSHFMLENVKSYLVPIKWSFVVAHYEIVTYTSELKINCFDGETV